MSVYRLKPRFRALLRPLARAIHRAGGTANQVTLAAAAGSVALGIAWWLVGSAWPLLWWLAAPWMLVRMALNAVDGLLAQEFGQRSVKGAYLNELGDAVSDAALWLPLAAVEPFSPVVVVLFVLTAGWTELAGALGPMVGASRRNDGPLGKSDRALVLAGLGLWIGLPGGLPLWATGVPWLLLALSSLTVLHRMGQGVREARTTRPSQRTP
jgi:CDP-diacylglycerol--glycerol-3-phosphate 3-phosphatidyltransferase